MKLKFNGKFIEFFGWSLAGVLLTVVTFGLLAPIIMFFQLKYFVDNVEIVK